MESTLEKIQYQSNIKQLGDMTLLEKSASQRMAGRISVPLFSFISTIFRHIKKWTEDFSIKFDKVSLVKPSRRHNLTEPG